MRDRESRIIRDLNHKVSRKLVEIAASRGMRYQAGTVRRHTQEP